MTIEEKLNKLPHSITSFDKIGTLKISNADENLGENNIDFHGYWMIGYITEDEFPIEAVYQQTSQVYLLSFCKGFENTLDDMLDRLKEGGFIDE